MIDDEAGPAAVARLMVGSSPDERNFRPDPRFREFFEQISAAGGKATSDARFVPDLYERLSSYDVVLVWDYHTHNQHRWTFEKLVNGYLAANPEEDLTVLMEALSERDAPPVLASAAREDVRAVRNTLAITWNWPVNALATAITSFSRREIEILPGNRIDVDWEELPGWIPDLSRDKMFRPGEPPYYQRWKFEEDTTTFAVKMISERLVRPSSGEKVKVFVLYGSWHVSGHHNAMREALERRGFKCAEVVPWGDWLEYRIGESMSRSESERCLEVGEDVFRPYILSRQDWKKAQCELLARYDWLLSQLPPLPTEEDKALSARILDVLKRCDFDRGVAAIKEYLKHDVMRGYARALLPHRGSK